MIAVDPWRLDDQAEVLGGVLLDVLFRAWVDEIDLQVGRLLCGGIAIAVARRQCTGEVPAVDIVIPEVLDVRERCRKA